MITLGKQIIHHEDKAYEVIRSLRDIDEYQMSIDELKQLMGADIALLRNGRYYFCELIKDIEDGST